MTSKLWFMVFMIFIPLFVQAQKPNTKLVEVKYLQPPTNLLPEHIKTYYVNVLNEAAGFITSTEQVKEAIELAGYERSLGQNEADLLIEFRVNSVNTEGSIEKVPWKKRINDSTYVDRVGAKYIVNAYMNINVLIKDQKDGTTLTSDAKSLAHSFESSRYDTYNAAVYASNANKGAKGKEMYKVMFTEAVSEFNFLLNNDFGYPTRTKYLPIAQGKGKKHDYSDLESAYNKFVQASKLNESQGLNSDVAGLLKECVFTWEKATEEYEDSKKARIGEKNIGHINYNIAVAKILLHDWEGVSQTIEKIKGTKVGTSDLNNLKALAIDLEQRFVINK